MTTVTYTPFAKCVQLHSLELCLSISSVKKHFEVPRSDFLLISSRSQLLFLDWLCLRTCTTALNNQLALQVDPLPQLTTFRPSEWLWKTNWRKHLIFTLFACSSATTNWRQNQICLVGYLLSLPHMSSTWILTKLIPNKRHSPLLHCTVLGQTFMELSNNSVLQTKTATWLHRELFPWDWTATIRNCTARWRHIAPNAYATDLARSGPSYFQLWTCSPVVAAGMVLLG